MSFIINIGPESLIITIHFDALLNQKDTFQQLLYFIKIHQVDRTNTDAKLLPCKLYGKDPTKFSLVCISIIYIWPSLILN